MISPGEKLLRLIFGKKSERLRCKDSDDFINMTELTCLTKKLLIEPGPERLIRPSPSKLDFKPGFDRMVHTFVKNYFFVVFKGHMSYMSQYPPRTRTLMAS